MEVELVKLLFHETFKLPLFSLKRMFVDSLSFVNKAKFCASRQVILEHKLVN